MPVLTMSQGLGQPDEEDFDPQLFEPTHPNDEGDETDVNECHQIPNLDLFVDDGMIDLNEGICFISLGSQQNLFRIAQDLLILLLFASR